MRAITTISSGSIPVASVVRSALDPRIFLLALALKYLHNRPLVLKAEEMLSSPPSVSPVSALATVTTLEAAERICSVVR